jgi:ATP-dependent helicase YprA (DUF1998 family)
MNPYEIWQEMKKIYMDYLSTAFRLDNAAIHSTKQNQMGQEGVLTRQPIIELLPEYESINKKIDDIEGEWLKNYFGDESKYKQFISLAKLLAPFNLYAHQFDMLKKALDGDVNGLVITTGTGSGKTESFMLPLLARLIRMSSKKISELKSIDWNEFCRSKNDDDNWYYPEKFNAAKKTCINNLKTRMDKGYGRFLPDELSKRVDDDACVKALILYPMNALVEDQVSRLRGVLDCDEGRVIQREGGGLFFGNYTGKAPGKNPWTSGRNEYNVEEEKLSKYMEAMRKLQKDDATINEFISNVKVLKGQEELIQIWLKEEDALERAKVREEIIKKISRDTEESKGFISVLLSEEEPKEQAKKRNLLKYYLSLNLNDVRNFMARMDGYELLSRYEMQDAPPDILITNVTMLNGVLNRKFESPLLEKTKSWLEKDEQNHKFQLVLDELHLYRGTAGTEISVLLRMFLNRIGLTPDSSQLQILASSASLEGEGGKQFLKEFFARNDIDVITARKKNIEDVDYNINQKEIKELLTSNDDSIQSNDKRVSDLWKATSHSLDKGAKFLFAEDTGARGGGSLMTDLCSNLDESQLQKAIRNFFKYREAVAEQEGVPRFRIHTFFKTAPYLQLNPSEFCSNDQSNVRLIESQSKVKNEAGNLDALYCEYCGELFAGGSISYKEGGEVGLGPWQEPIEGVPDLDYCDSLINEKWSKYRIIWKSAKDMVPLADKVADGAYITGSSVWQQVVFNPKTNAYSVGETWGQDHKYWAFSPKDSKNKNSDAMPCDCPNCGVDRSNALGLKSPIRAFRGGATQITQLLTSSMMGNLSEGADQTVAFSDSRNGAARLAKRLEENHLTDLMVQMLVNRLYPADSDLREKVSSQVKDLNAKLCDAVKYFNEKAGGNFCSGWEILDCPASDMDVNDWLYCLVEKFELNGRLCLTYPNRETLFDIIKDLKQDFRDRLTQIDKSAENWMENFVNGEVSNYEFKPIDLIRLVTPEEPLSLFEMYRNLGHDPFLKGGIKINQGENERWTYWSRLERETEDDKKTIYLQLKKRYLGELVPQLFQRLYYSVDRMGLGRIGLPPETNYSSLADQLKLTPKEAEEICFSMVRLLGETFHHSYSNTGNDAGTKNIRMQKLERGFSTIAGEVEGRRWVEIILRFLSETKVFDLTKDDETNRLQYEHGLIVDKLYLYPVDEEESLYIGKRSRRLHLGKGTGYCYFTGEKLVKTPQKVGELRRKHVRSVHALREKPIKRLRTEELSGQTDDYSTRQRHFRKLFLEKELSTGKGNEIDLLSVTTTLEVGVDIGNLQSIILANMPPNRFNYQQRVGRAGRRGQPFSFVFTYCMGRSHDLFYFEKPWLMVSSPTAAPFLSMNESTITCRLIGREVLRQVLSEFREDRVYLPLQTRGSGNLEGEFGNCDVENINLVKHILKVQEEKFLKRASELSQALSLVYNEEFLEKMRSWLNRILATLSDDHIILDPNMALSSYLTQSGFLPLFGLPSVVRNMHHPGGEVDAVADIALYNYAPGNTVTKDKKVYQSVGFAGHKVAGKFKGNWYRSVKKFQQCKNDHCQTVWANDQLERCPKCQSEVQDCSFYQPLSYIAKRINHEDFKSGYRRPRTSNFIFTDKALETVSAKVECKSSVETFILNTNGNELFSGQELIDASSAAMCSIKIDGGDVSEHLNEFKRYFPHNGASWQNKGPFGLYEPKVTDVMGFRVLPQSQVLDLSSRHMCAVASRGAHYSASFILQRAFAGINDVVPEELEIGFLELEKMDSATGIVSEGPVMTLSDATPNGSGMSHRLFSQFDYLIKESNSFETKDQWYDELRQHGEHCETACSKCLKTYHNQIFHGVLDWRLGLCILGLLANDGWLVGDDHYSETDYQISDVVKVLTKNLEGKTATWDFMDLAKRAGKYYAESFEEVEFLMVEECYPCLLHKSGDSFYLLPIWHPLWKYDMRDNVEDRLIFAMKKSLEDWAGTHSYGFLDFEENPISNSKSKYPLNTFDMFRRPLWVYGEIKKKIVANHHGAEFG